MSQSRWVQEFQQHPFQSIWKSLKIESENAEVVDPTDLTTLMELARFKRLIAYIDGILQSLDPELVPKTIWPNFHNQIVSLAQHIQEYKNSKNTANLVAANDQADNLLSYVRPWMATPADAFDIVRGAATDYTSALEKQIKKFVDEANGGLKDIKSLRTHAVSRMKGLNDAAARIEDFAKTVFDGDGDIDSLESRIKNAVENAESLHADVNGIHAKLLLDKPEQKSIATSISDAEKRIVAVDKTVTATISQVEEKTAELEKFHDKIFGYVDARSGDVVTGLKGELDQRIVQLDKYEQDQKHRHEALFNKIENLLPGANSAGLASAYRVMKMSFVEPIKNYTLYFYCSLALLGVGSLLLWVENFSIDPFSVTFVGIKPWDELLRALLGKVAFFIPVVWLAIFSATRRSQYERLQQEYAHKETFASSYDSYKKELRELGDSTSELQKLLLDKAILAVAFNASSTLDGKDHLEKPPVLKFLEKADPELIKKWAEAIAKK